MRQEFQMGEDLSLRRVGQSVVHFSQVVSMFIHP